MNAFQIMEEIINELNDSTIDSMVRKRLQRVEDFDKACGFDILPPIIFARFANFGLFKILLPFFVGKVGFEDI